MKKIFSHVILLLMLLPMSVFGQVDAPEPRVSNADAYVFVRDDCSHCQDLKEFVIDNQENLSGYNIVYIDLYTETGRKLFDQATDILNTGKVTPITLLDGQAYVGFDELVVGKKILEHATEKSRSEYSFDWYLQSETQTNQSGEGCSEGSFEPCAEENKTLTIPVLGEIDPQTVSLSFLAITLGFVDGFNPCAMWVLLTFLLILSQVGSRKKMIQVAGLFIVAEAFMYYMILNVWYQTWDFVALDGIVTPLVGLLGVGSGLYFLYKFYSSRNKPLTCDVTSIEHQQKTESRIQNLISKPMSIGVALAIIGLALSVNIIEFACSIGIPQAFTKILELNQLTFMGYQAYTLLYTVFYMADDVIVFGLAIWGYSKFYSVGHKYSRYSTGVAGILMLILGIILLSNPDLLAY